MPATRRTSRLPWAPAAHGTARAGRIRGGHGSIRVVAPILAAAMVGSCGGLPLGPTATPSGPMATTSGPMATPSIAEPEASATPVGGAITSPTTSHTASPVVGPMPAIVIRVPAENGSATWTLVRPGSGVAGSPLRVEPADAELGPAAADGTLLLSGKGRILSAVVAGDRLRTTASHPIPGDRAFVPACIAGDGRTIVADAETLDLFVLVDAGLEPLTDLHGLLGECAPLADGRTLISTEGGALTAVGPGGIATAVEGTRGRHLSGGGGLVAMIDPSTETGEVVVRRGTVDGAGRLDPVIARVAADGTERLPDAQLSPDGRWLAVTVLGDGDGATGAGAGGGATGGASGGTTGDDRLARLRVYAITGDGLVEVADEPLELGARYALLPGGGPSPP